MITRPGVGEPGTGEMQTGWGEGQKRRVGKVSFTLSFIEIMRGAEADSTYASSGYTA